MWLKSDYMQRHHVQKARRKHLYIMYLIKEVGNRIQGMGLKVVKFHAIMHMVRDIYMFRTHGIKAAMLPSHRSWGPITFT